MMSTRTAAGAPRRYHSLLRLTPVVVILAVTCGDDQRGPIAPTMPMQPPASLSPTSFTVVEGETSVGTLSARDPDTPVAALVWSITGGADSGDFALSTSGVLAFTAAKDYEAPDDVDSDGTYGLTVQVSDGTAAAMAAIRVSLSNRNEAPTANAGFDQPVVEEGVTVTLSGRGEDPDAGDALRYAWTQTHGATVTLSAPAAALTTFAAPTGLTEDAVLTFTLRVTDAGGLSAEDDVTVTVVAEPGPEVVGPTSFTVVEGETSAVTLSARDPDTPVADLVWSITGGADSGHFALRTSGVLAFTAAKDYESPDDADSDGTYGLTVQVSDGPAAAMAAIRVSLSNRNEAPTANAGFDQPVVEEGVTVTLSGRGEDPDAGDALRYAWTQTNGATVTLSAPAAALTTFVAPTGLTEDAVLTFTLRVTDADGLSAEDEVTVTVVAEIRPEVVGPTSFTVVEGETSVGTLSARDPDTPVAALVWSITGGADSGDFALSTSGVLAFTAAKDYESPDDADSDGTYGLTVQVSDGTAAAMAAIRVSLSNRNEAPTANAGFDQPVVEEGVTVTLRGRGEDPDAGDALRYAWTQTHGATVTLSAPAAALTTFVAPTGLTEDAVLTFTLRVTDAGGLSAEDEVTVTVVAEPGPEVVGPTSFTVVEGETSVGTLSARDPDTPVAALVWSITGGADSGDFALRTSGVLAFTAAKDYESPDDADSDGTYGLTVQVSDGPDAAMAAIRVSLSNRNEAPTANAGADQPGVEEGVTVTLRGRGEDPDAGDALRYAWTQTNGATVTLSAPAAALTTFAAPTGLTEDAVLTFTLRVTDAGGLSAEDEVTVIVVAETVPPGAGICDRTEQVRTTILAQIPGIDTCSAVTDANLATVRYLSLSNAGISSLRSGDFAGLANLQGLGLHNNQIGTLPAGVFEGLTNLRGILLTSNRLEALPKDVFAGLSGLRTLDLEYNELSTLPEGVFSGLDLRFLGLEANKLRTLPAGMFAGLKVETLDLSDNETNGISGGVFAGLTTLVHVDLGSNRLDTLPAGVFAGLTSLWRLWLDENPGANFTFTMTVERGPGTNTVVVTVPQGAPFDMTTTISATGGTLPVGVSSVTVRAGHTTSDAITVTPLAGTTITLGAPPPVPGSDLRFNGFTTAVGAPVTF